MEEQDSYSNMKLPKVSRSQLSNKWNRYNKSLRKRMTSISHSNHYSEHLQLSYIKTAEDIKDKSRTDSSLNKSKLQSDELSKITHSLAVKSKERAKRNRAVLSRKSLKNYKRREDEKHLKEENMRILKKLQSSNPTYSYDNFEEENKRKRQILDRLCYFPYMLDEFRSRKISSKINIRRNLKENKQSKMISENSSKKENLNLQSNNEQANDNNNNNNPNDVYMNKTSDNLNSQHKIIKEVEKKDELDADANSSI